ncbi:hypothetical protein DFO67_13510 [Modicisalibacter xianhensis]|uniref:Uncharacterized protein n=1 Tax=Modicisalibacter xianhensis TaxID=442341 RepID=A0A4R8F7Q8_9GAMM|nr:hypothetical protein [Halomonas xianhensis]TDX21600.1 hypothetical protein DFO67_13510 [Halomonas xianhensis]
MDVISTINIEARLWYRRSYGECRHSVIITTDAGHTLTAKYLWDGKWDTTAALIIQALGWLPPRPQTPLGVPYGLSRWARENGVTLVAKARRVPRRMDL